ncbi:MAG: hypothetical protein ACTSPG_10280 [Candidatus Hodarchaeales archaeon]
MEEKVFAIKFECGNCGAKWEEQFCQRDKVSGEFCVYVKDHRCTAKPDCPYCRYIQCPVCKRQDVILVKERYPLRKGISGKINIVESNLTDATKYYEYDDGITKIIWKTYNQEVKE